MKHLITVFCLFLTMLLIQSSALAQPTDGITFRQNWYNYITPQPQWEDWTDVYNNVDGRGLEIAYNRNLTKHTWLVVPVKFGVGRQSAGGRNALLGNLDVIFENRLCKYGNLINPTIHLGVGSTWNFDQEEFDFNIPAGLGMNVRLLPNLYVNLQSQFRFSIENRPGWHHGVGLVVLWGDQNPDRDKDGIGDKDDKCPDVFGVASLMGCPDKDGDGITDSDDKCPDVAGVAALMGCPDKDGDMITDAEDDCPTVKGLAAFKGCPDTDNDGIKDSDDKCPREAGPASHQGCPIRDKDGDGIEDKDDKCPNDKGPSSTMGCPDRDSDGVADKDDACPDKKGDSAHKGCPDTDGDGIYDNEDRCPDKAGVAALRGCPEIKKEDKAKLERAIKLVQFETGKDVLLQKSYAVLDEVVSVMNQYSEYSLNIAGHTDNQGDDKLNQELSERRAKRCYDYLVSKGVAATRMAHAGYGETKPVADNKTADGRSQNRRVEFELYVK
ncbi:MAG: OmpA family protein [Saprospiraceae bacterium]|nr:OmpA family protein [Saprospiraceae bacterium]